MFRRLVWKNVKKSIQDYIIYFVSLLAIFSLIYAFLSLAFSPVILGLSENLSVLKNIIFVLTAFVLLIASGIIAFSIKFIFNHRKKEFATYFLVGVKRSQISMLFILENGIIYITAFVSSIVVGQVLSNCFSIITLKLFDTPLSVQAKPSIEAVACLFCFFSCLFVICIFKVCKVLHTQKIIDLLNSRQKNEHADMNMTFGKIICLGVYLVLISIGVVLLKLGLGISSNAAFMYFLSGFFLVIFGVYKLYRILPIVLSALLMKNTDWKYKTLNLFSLKQIIAKINTTGSMMAIVAILLTLALTAMSVGLSMGAAYHANLESDYPYDIAVAFDAEINLKEFADVIDFVAQSAVIKDYVSYYLYGDDAYQNLDFLALSDYNRLREQLGLDQKVLLEDQFLVHCSDWYLLNSILEKVDGQPTLPIGQKSYKSKRDLVFTEAMEQMWMAGRNGYAVILPDAAVSEFGIRNSRLVISTLDEAPKELRGSLEAYLNHKWKPQILAAKDPEHIFMGTIVQSWSVANSLGGFTLIAFSSLYLSLILIVFAGAVLGFQQLSDIEKNRRQFQILYQLGVSQSTLKKELLRELLVCFGMPFVMPVVITCSLLAILNSTYGKYIAAGNLFLFYTMISIGVTLIIYGCYFAITYFTCKRNILKY